MQVSETLIRQVVQQVLAEVGDAPPVAYQGKHGIFNDVSRAVAAAKSAFEELENRSKAVRKQVTDIIRRISIDQCVELGTMEMEETKIGRLEHKIDKQRSVAELVPGVEFLETQSFSGDDGIALVEYAPFGVIGAITPVTHSLPTITSNSISMISAGNSMVINPHPGGKRIAAEGVRRYNEAISREVGIDNLLCIIAEPTLETAEEIFSHRDISLICVTGGPAVARAALNSGKRAVVAGPGNPPVVVDETADLDRAARSIIAGGAYDNNLLCIAEKEVFAVDSIFDDLMAAMERAGAVRLNATEIDRLTAVAITQVGEGARRHDVAAKDFIGQDAAVLARAAGREIPADTMMVFGETDCTNPFVPVEQMMPFVPFVRCSCVDDAIAKAKHFEHGFRHTAILHTNNLKNITKMGRIMDTTLLAVNGPSFCSMGVEGEGYLSYSIATPTGEGVTTPLTFTRQRRLAIGKDLCILGK